MVSASDPAATLEIRAALRLLTEQVQQQGHTPVPAAHHPREHYLLVRCETCNRLGEVRYLATGAIAPESLRGEAITGRCHPEDGRERQSDHGTLMLDSRRLRDALCGVRGPATSEERTQSTTLTTRIWVPIRIRQS